MKTINLNLEELKTVNGGAKSCLHSSYEFGKCVGEAILVVGALAAIGIFILL